MIWEPLDAAQRNLYPCLTHELTQLPRLLGLVVSGLLHMQVLFLLFVLFLVRLYVDQRNLYTCSKVALLATQRRRPHCCGSFSWVSLCLSLCFRSCLLKVTARLEALLWGSFKARKKCFNRPTLTPLVSVGQAISCKTCFTGGFLPALHWPRPVFGACPASVCHSPPLSARSWHTRDGFSMPKGILN